MDRKPYHTSLRPRAIDEVAEAMVLTNQRDAVAALAMSVATQPASARALGTAQDGQSHHVAAASAAMAVASTNQGHAVAEAMALTRQSHAAVALEVGAAREEDSVLRGSIRCSRSRMSSSGSHTSQAPWRATHRTSWGASALPAHHQH